MGKYITYSERMQVTVPVGEVDGLVVEKFEVKHPDDWLETDKGRTDVVTSLAYVRMIQDGRECWPGWYTRLLDTNVKDANGRSLIWMSDTTAERLDHAKMLAAIQMMKASRVVINGLGLGMVVAGALSYNHVRHIDVVEKDERVIKLIGPHYEQDPRVHIHHADAYEQMKAWPRGVRWDVGWSDVWPQISADNLPSMDELHAFYRVRCQFHGMWARKECLALRRELHAYGLI